MKSLNKPADRAALLRRLERIRPDTQRRWGRMTAPQMICHLTDSFRGVMGQRVSTSASPKLPRWRQRLIKLVALHLPLRWPHGVKTRADVDQERGGTAPADFQNDVAELVRACHEFATDDRAPAPHYLFGPMSRDDWGRWGYRHMDHHFRQFGV